MRMVDREFNPKLSLQSKFYPIFKPMKKIILLFLITNFIGSNLTAQSITIQPYLQDVSSNVVHILWETNINGESAVEWGPTESLGNETTGISYASNGNATIHEAVSYTHLTLPTTPYV